MTLRQLARRALHRVHLPPPPLASFSSGIRGHIFLRLSTSSSDQPHFIVDYLVSTCGLPPDKAAKAAPRFAHVPVRLLASRRDLDGLGLDADELRLPAHLFGVFDGHGGAEVRGLRRRCLPAACAP